MKKREQWSSNLGFIIVTASGAVGLGNIWKFPYVVTHNGGGFFLISYVILTILIGYPLMMAETAIGRHSRNGLIKSFSDINSKWGFIGYLSAFTSLLILSTYCVVGGWLLKYLFVYIANISIKQPVTFYNSFISSTFEPILWFVIFIALCMFIIFRGIQSGLEKISKIMLPGLIILLLIIMIKTLSLPNAIKGLYFLFIPDLSQYSDIGAISNIFFQTISQVFFSLSIGMGMLVTFGTYLSKQSNIKTNSIIVPAIDVFVAIIAAITIVPALFSFNIDVKAGPGLIFHSLPYVFDHITNGRIYGILFFISIAFAAITSAISLLEIIVAFAIDRFNLKRKTATTLVGAIVLPLGILASLSFGVMSSVPIYTYISDITDKFLIPLGGLVTCIFVGYIWKPHNAINEISNSGKLKFRFAKFFTFIIKYASPIFITAVFISSFFIKQ